MEGVHSKSLKDFAEKIVKGERPLEDSDHKPNMSTTFFTNAEDMGLEYEFIKCATKLHRVKLFERYFEWIEIPKGSLDNLQKNTEMAECMLHMGKNYLMDCHLELALRALNLAMLFVPTSENEMIYKILMARSALLIDMEKPSDALEDLNVAEKSLLEISSDEGARSKDEEKKKIGSQKLKCSKILRAHQYFIDQCPGNLKNDREKRKKFKDNLLFKIKTPSKMAPCAENFVEIKTASKKGRSIIVNRDIPPGTTLIVEDPYVKILKENSSWDLEHCRYCLKQLWRGVPCSSCVFACYCSEDCLNKDYEASHRYECSCLPYLHWTKTPRYVQLVLKIIWSLGPKKYLQLWTDQPPEFKLPWDKRLGKIIGVDPVSKVYASDSYLQIYHLMSHEGVLQPDEISSFTNIIQALMNSHMILNLTDFFPKTLDPEFFTFLTSVILHHLESIHYNSISINAVRGLEGTKGYSALMGLSIEEVKAKVKSITSVQFAAGVYSLCSLLNHSCIPNVTRIHNDNGTIAIVATKALKCNEELVTSYSRIFIADSLDERRDFLQKNYRFFCNCIACEEDWPLITDLCAEDPKFLCPTCKGENPKTASGSKKTVKFSQSPPYLNQHGRCAQCGVSHDISELMTELSDKMDGFFHSYEMVCQNKPFDSIRAIAPVLQYFQKNISSPFSKHVMAQDILKRALDLIMFYSEECH